MKTNAAHADGRIEQTLHVRHGGESCAAAAADAWLLLGSNPTDWLAELTRWRVPLVSVRLLPLPTSAKDRRPAGVLAIAAGVVPHDVGRRALPYRCIAGRLYIPAEARLHPPVSDAEVERICPWKAALIHPSIGLVGFAEAEILRAIDLIRAEPPFPSSWEEAEPGLHAEPRIREVRPEVVPSFEQVIDAARGDIGEAPLDELPPTPDESRLRQLGRQARLGGIEALRKLLPNAKGPSASSGLTGKLSGWATRRADALRAQIAAARQRELSRLMRLLEENPDEGLRYALPLNNALATRGVVEGGARLARRDTSFDLGNLFGSRPTSFWETPWEAQQRLQARYRELANRELSLGRHRRAAYIFSELLGDHHNAASALAQGRFFREAATLYREKLKNPAAAAACLEGGGLLQEAADAYESIGQFEKAGDLHASLDAGAEANRLYRAALDACTARGDTLGAAGLLERKLIEPDAALACLTDAWERNANQSDQCLRESFALLARLGRHEASERRLIDLRDAAPNTSRPAALARVLADVAAAYPTREARQLARDAARVVAGYGLANDVHALEHGTLLQVVARTNVEDRLLHRDAIRYGESQKRPAPARPKGTVQPTPSDPPKPPRRTLELIGRIALPAGGVAWKTAAAIEGGFLALGVTDSEVVLARGNWKGTIQTSELRFPDAAGAHFRMAGTRDRVIIAPLATTRRLPRSTLPRFQDFPEMEVGHPSLLPDGAIYGIAFDDNGHYRILRATSASEVLLDRVSAEGVLLSTVPSRLAPSDFADLESLWMHAHGDHLLITAGSRLHWMTRDVFQRFIPLPGAARGLCGAPRHTALRVAVSLEDRGCAIVWPQQPDLKPFAATVDGAMPALLSDGVVVVIGHGAGLVYELSNRSLLPLGETKIGAGAPAKVIISDSVCRHVATLYPNGELHQFAVK